VALTAETATGTLVILNDKGHTPVLWNADTKEGVDEAIKVFEEEMAAGRTAYVVEGTERTTVKKDTSGRFQLPVEAEQVVIVAPLVGG
jgi:hypothetical protein